MTTSGHAFCTSDMLLATPRLFSLSYAGQLQCWHPTASDWNTSNKLISVASGFSHSSDSTTWEILHMPWIGFCVGRCLSAEASRWQPVTVHQSLILLLFFGLACLLQSTSTANTTWVEDDEAVDSSLKLVQMQPVTHNQYYNLLSEYFMCMIWAIPYLLFQLQ